MAIVPKNVEKITRSGLAATYNGSLSTSDTYQIPNDGQTQLHFKKSGAGACTVTILVNQQVDGLTVPNKTINVPATTGDVFVGPFPVSIYGNPVSFTLSEVTGLTFAAIRNSN